MPRIRYIKPGFWENDELAECSFGARLLWIGIWSHADRNGIAKAKPAKLRGQVFRFDEVTIAEVEVMLGELEAHGFVELYEVAGEAYAFVPNFTKHQKIHVNECAYHPLRDGSLPPKHEPSTNQAPDKVGAGTDQAPTQQPKERERERERELEQEDSPPLADPPPKEPTDGSKLKASWFSLYAYHHDGKKPTWNGRTAKDAKTLTSAHGLPDCLERLRNLEAHHAANSFAAEIAWRAYVDHFDRWGSPPDGRGKPGGKLSNGATAQLVADRFKEHFKRMDSGEAPDSFKIGDDHGKS